MDVTDNIFLVFAFITIYCIVLFMLLHYRNRHELFKEVKAVKLPSVTIIIPAYNEEENIAATIRAVKDFAYPSNLLEVFVVDDGSKDHTAARAKEAGVTVFSKKNDGKAAALNYGISKARGEIVGCVDADSHPEREALRRMVPYFEEARVAAVTSSVLVRNASTCLERLQEMEYLLIAWGRKLLDYLQSVYVTPGPLSLYRKDIIKKVGGFDRTILTEDIEIAWRLHSAGYTVRMALDARVYTKAPRSFKKWWNQRLRWDIGGIQTIKMHKYAAFRRRYEIFGLFIIPFFSLSILLSLIGLGLFTYLMGTRAMEFAAYAYYSWIAGINPLQYYPLNILPNVFTVLGLLGFLMSIAYLLTGLRAMGYHIRPRTFIDMLLYLLPYLFLFPLLLIHSFWRLLAYKKQGW
ncbi:MAG: glycosyltransferase [Candidatus Altiarchaeota archaeon]|nr:glycosyltransferase [Candidatus Altiarchaeota archaeon]